MWEVVNETPFGADGSWGRNRDGLHEWIVAVKATFHFGDDGRPHLCDPQPEPLLEAVHHGEAGASSLRYDADLVGPKPTTDIVLNATAYAPRGRPATEFPAFFRVGPVQKSLRVVGDRTWGRLGLPSSPRPVLAVPVLYELAYGGCDDSDPDPRRWRLDLRNPVGRGVVARPERRVGQPLPNVEPLAGDVEKAGPAGFGPLAPHWSPRRERCGTYDARWQQSRAPLLPLDWDPRCLQCAPLDQQSPVPLRGGELVELVNLTPSGVLRFSLPTADLRFRTRIGRTLHDHIGTVSTVMIEPDDARLSITWLSCLPCTSSIDYLEETTVRVVGAVE